MQYRHRYYYPGLGRFVSHDPLRYLDAPNLFGYVKGWATTAADPMGSSTVVEVGNPKLPHRFIDEAGQRRVITGTVWEVYDDQGRLTFRQGIASAGTCACMSDPFGGGSCPDSRGPQSGGGPSFASPLVGQEDAANPYRAFRNTPRQRTDPTGLIPTGPGDVIKCLYGHLTAALAAKIAQAGQNLMECATMGWRCAEEGIQLTPRGSGCKGGRAEYWEHGKVQLNWNDPDLLGLAQCIMGVDVNPIGDIELVKVSQRWMCRHNGDCACTLYRDRWITAFGQNGSPIMSMKATPLQACKGLNKGVTGKTTAQSACCKQSCCGCR
jgi:hypothetical protein